MERRYMTWRLTLQKLCSDCVLISSEAAYSEREREPNFSYFNVYHTLFLFNQIVKMHKIGSQMP